MESTTYPHRVRLGAGPTNSHIPRPSPRLGIWESTREILRIRTEFCVPENIQYGYLPQGFASHTHHALTHTTHMFPPPPLPALPTRFRRSLMCTELPPNPRFSEADTRHHQRRQDRTSPLTSHEPHQARQPPTPPVVRSPSPYPSTRLYSVICMAR